MCDQILQYDMQKGTYHMCRVIDPLRMVQLYDNLLKLNQFYEIIYLLLLLQR